MNLPTTDQAKTMSKRGLDRLEFGIINSSAFNWGVRSYNLGYPKSDNPFTPGTDNFTHWASGWLSEHAKFINTLKRFSANTK